VGDTVRYSLTYTHPEEELVLFADSSYDFSPFEFRQKRPFPSRLENGMVVDSALYVLTSFELDSVQSLAIPIFIVDQEGGRTIKLPNLDEILFDPMVPVLPDTVKLVPQLTAPPLETVFNEARAIFWGVILIVLLIVALAFAIKPFQRYLKRKKLEKEKGRFDLAWQEFQANAQDKSQVKALNVQFRRFLSTVAGIDAEPMTTREIIAKIDDPKLAEALKAFDRTIYNPKHLGNEDDKLAYLKEKADRMYKHQLESIK
jgi:hypothetical protein